MTTPLVPDWKKTAVDWFKADIGPDGEMYDSALAFLEAGGLLTWADWARLDPDSRRVWRNAGRALAALRCASTGLAAQGRTEAARCAAPADGGDALVRLGLDAAMSRAERILA